MKKKIFISYSHVDHIFANTIARYLLRRGHDVWIDSRQLKVQCKWADDIDTAIRESDYVLCILTADSVRRREVLREICAALDEGPGKLLPVVVGRIHDSWYANPRSEQVKKLKSHLKTYQNICFNGRGDITEDKMRQILECLESGVMETMDEDRTLEDAGDYYIAVNGIPAEMIDGKCNLPFYKVQSDDLSPVTGYPFAMDNQWIPESVIQDPGRWRMFEKDGFASEELREIFRAEQKKALLLSLIHMKQLVINKSAILNNLALRDCYMQKADRKAFLSLLENGSIVVFLYGQEDMSPFVHSLPTYETSSKAVQAWNQVCKEVPVYCIRENWKNAIDQHSIDFVKFCCTIADNIDDNRILAESFGMNDIQKQQFFRVLKDIAVQGFVRTRMTGTNIYTSIKGLSRSYFYSSFITREKENKDEQPVLNCLFDKDKPFHMELKRMVDMFYNSLFTNYFRCFALLPPDLPVEMVYLSKMYLEHSQNTIAEAELEYALSEFIGFEPIHKAIATLGEEIYLDNWDIQMVQKLRRTRAWTDYASALETIIKRSTNWQADFSEISNLVDQFVRAAHSMRKYISGGNGSRIPEPSYSFQVSIGSNVIQLAVGERWRKYKDVSGAYKGNQNPIQISFCIGDITEDCERDMIFYPVILFDGMTDFVEGFAYHDAFIQYLKDNDFIEIV